MLTRWRLQTHTSIKKLFHKLENSIQTYINYCKTHAMATHYGGIGDTSMENPETQDMDNDSVKVQNMLLRYRICLLLLIKCSPVLIPRQLRFSLYSGAVITEDLM